MSESVIIIGASHAAAQTSVSLRQAGYSSDITVIGDEPVLPYHRPPLSKDFLSGQKSIEDILIRPAESYETANIKMKLGVRVSAINPKDKTVFTDEGEALPYSSLVITTGARIRRLPVPGENLDNVFYLRDTQDVLGLEVLTSCERTYKADMVIIGIGVVPNVELAEAAGLNIGNGIEVNEFCQTSDPNRYQ